MRWQVPGFGPLEYVTSVAAAAGEDGGSWRVRWQAPVATRVDASTRLGTTTEPGARRDPRSRRPALLSNRLGRRRRRRGRQSRSRQQRPPPGSRDCSTSTSAARARRRGRTGLLHPGHQRARGGGSRLRSAHWPRSRRLAQPHDGAARAHALVRPRAAGHRRGRHRGAGRAVPRPRFTPAISPVSRGSRSASTSASPARRRTRS